MIELNELAFQNADVLIALDAAPNGQLTKKSLAQQLGRDDSNLGKTLRRLQDEGVLDPDDAMAGLTPAGAIQLAAIQRARHGGDKRKLRGRWPIDRIVRNPANRRTDSLAVLALADTIEAAGDVLQNVQLTPPDATGVRMLLAGEHRWEAVQLLAAKGRLPDALTDGLPFTERDADPAEQILIRIVENSARADLSPLEDARQLLALQEATGWSAREVAKKTGRSPADRDTGVRDVQLKIKIAREATEEAIAEYERTGSWDALRDSVSTRQAPPARPAPAAPLSADDPDWVLNPPWRCEDDQELRIKAQYVDLRIFSHPDGRWFVSASTQINLSGRGESYRIDQLNRAHPDRRSALEAARARVMEYHPDLGRAFVDWLNALVKPDTGAATTAQAPAPVPHPDAEEPPLFETEALLQHQAIPSPFAAREGGAEPMITLTAWRNNKGDIGWGWTLVLDDGARDDRDPQEFIANADLGKGRVIARLRSLWRDRLPPAAHMWLDAQIGPHVVNGQDFYNAGRAAEARVRLGWVERKSNSGGGSTPASFMSGPAGPDPTADDARDIWGRDHNTAVAEHAALQKVEDFVLGAAGHSTPGYHRQLLRALGLDGPFGFDGPDVVVMIDGQLRPQALDSLTANVSPQRRQAFAALTAWALNRAFADPAEAAS